MAGETIRTEGIVLDIRPWSQTSHVVTWLTPRQGPVTTLVKGAVRPKSAFLGQYDLFYSCDLVYYARSKGELHAIREVAPVRLRERLRGDFRATALASYVAYLVRENCPHNAEAADWFGYLEVTLDGLALDSASFRTLVRLETGFLRLAGLSPDFSDADFGAGEVPFSVDLGQAVRGGKTVLLPPGAAKLVAAGGSASGIGEEDVVAAVRFLGLFMRYHLDLPPEIRRGVVELLALKRWNPLQPRQ